MDGMCHFENAAAVLRGIARCSFADGSLRERIIMARKTFFSFFYVRDAWRAAQVRNCNMLPSEDQVGFIDAVEWESIQRQGDDAIKHWINGQLDGTSATALLVGAETDGRAWVLYEILESWNRGNGIVGIRIHNIKDQNGATDTAGRNPLDQFKLQDGTLLSSICKTYDWVLDDGRKNLGAWLDEACQIRAEYDKCSKVVYASEVTSRVKAASASAGFTPRAPWCSDRADRQR
jgi:hypothetical protein